MVLEIVHSLVTVVACKETQAVKEAFTGGETARKPAIHYVIE